MTGPQHSRDELRLYFEVLQSMSEGVSITDSSGTILYTNAAEDKLFGYEPGELAGKHVSTQNAYPPEENQRIVAEVVRQLTQHGSWRGEWHNKRKDGSTFYTEARIHTVDTAGQRYFICVRDDITERRRAEEALRASEARFAETVRSSPFGIAIWSPEGVLSSANPALLRIVGRTWEEMPKEVYGWEAITPPEYHELERTKLSELYQTGVVEPFTKEYIRPDGTRVPALLAARVLSTGEAACYVVELTEQHRAEVAARGFQERLHLAQRAARIGTWDWNLVTGQISWSPELYELVGLSPEKVEASMEAWLAIMHPDDRQVGMDRAREAIQAGGSFESEFRIVDGAGRVRWLLGRAEVFQDSAGQPVRLVGLNMDITARKEAEEVLRVSNEDLHQLAYSASHDLREPLRMVAIYSQLLDKHYRDKFGEAGNLYLRYTLEGAQRMEALVRDLLAYTQAIGPETMHGVADAGEACALALGNLRAAIEDSGAEVNVGPLPKVASPLTPLTQVFQNLIGNALKYRKAGRPPIVDISAAERGKEWVFRVADNGIGIPPAYHRQVFGLFKRLHSNEEYSGSGIGLAICQRIIGRLGGRIWVESQPDEGSTFYFALPGA